MSTKTPVLSIAHITVLHLQLMLLSLPSAAAVGPFSRQVNCSTIPSADGIPFLDNQVNGRVKPLQGFLRHRTVNCQQNRYSRCKKQAPFARYWRKEGSPNCSIYC